MFSLTISTLQNKEDDGKTPETLPSAVLSLNRIYPTFENLKPFWEVEVPTVKPQMSWNGTIQLGSSEFLRRSTFVYCPKRIRIPLYDAHTPWKTIDRNPTNWLLANLLHSFFHSTSVIIQFQVGRIRPWPDGIEMVVQARDTKVESTLASSLGEPMIHLKNDGSSVLTKDLRRKMTVFLKRRATTNVRTTSQVQVQQCIKYSVLWLKLHWKIDPWLRCLRPYDWIQVIAQGLHTSCHDYRDWCKWGHSACKSSRRYLLEELLWVTLYAQCVTSGNQGHAMTVKKPHSLYSMNCYRQKKYFCEMCQCQGVIC